MAVVNKTHDHALLGWVGRWFGFPFLVTVGSSSNVFPIATLTSSSCHQEQVPDTRDQPK